MVSYSTNEFKNGLKILVDGNPCGILEHEFCKPGKGQAFTRVKLRNLLTGQVWEKTFKSGEKAEGADVMDIEAQFLYNDNSGWHFMKNDDSYEQLAVSAEVIGETSKWLQEGCICNVTLYNDQPVRVEPPQTVEALVVSTDPGIKGDTVSGGSKPAVLESGATVKVPLFVQEGEKIKVNTASGEYLSRAK